MYILVLFLPRTRSWYVGVWEECSASCGVGLQTRTVFCQRAVDGDMHVIVDSLLCDVAGEPRPDSKQPCDSGAECPSWRVGDWSKV